MNIAIAIVGGCLISVGWILPSNKPAFWVVMPLYVLAVAILRWPK